MEQNWEYRNKIHFFQQMANTIQWGKDNPWTSSAETFE